MAVINDFLRKDYPTVAPADTLEAVMERLLAPPGSSEEQADCFVVLEGEGRPVGLINAGLVLKALGVGAEKEDEPAVDVRMRDRLKLPVTAAMANEFPVAAPDAGLFDVLAPLGTNYFECLPVMRGEHYLGAARTIDLFQALAEEVLGASGGVFTDL